MTAAMVGPLEVASVHIRRLKPADCEAVCALHTAVIASLSDRGFMYQHDRSYFHRMLGGAGYIAGAYIGGDLVGYSAFFPPRRGVIGLASQLSHIGIDPQDVAEGAGSAVHPEHRRQGIFQQLLVARFDSARALGIPLMASVVALRNVASLRRMLALNCFVAANYRDADGDNFLLIKALKDDQRLPSACGNFVPIHAAPAHLQYLCANRYIGLPAALDGQAGISYVERDQWAHETCARVELDRAEQKQVTREIVDPDTGEITTP